MRRLFASLWLLTAATLLLRVPCTWEHRYGFHSNDAIHYSGWFFVWQTGNARISYGQIAAEELAVLLLGAAACVAFPGLRPFSK